MIIFLRILFFILFLASFIAFINPEWYFKNRKKKLTRRELFKTSVTCLVLFWIFANVGGETEPTKTSSPEVVQQETSNKTNNKTVQEKINQQTERKKIYVEPETAKYDPETGKWIICSNEDKPAHANEIRIKPGTEKYYPELNALVICKSKSQTTQNTTTSATVADKDKSPIIGSTKEQILSTFDGWRRDYEYENNVDSSALKFENESLIVVVDFNSKNIAEGVSFLSNNLKGDDIITGENSYVNKNYNNLVQWATGGKKMKIGKNVTTRYPVDIWIGNIHE